MSRQQYQNYLCAGLDKMAVSLSEGQINLLMDYLQELIKWNKAYNLSAIRDPMEMVQKHLLDSLVLVPLIHQKLQHSSQPIRLLDVGTGAGLPGIPLAIACPELLVTLLDSNGKKTRFLFQVKLSLSLDNVEVENSRVENYQPEANFTLITSRAFSSLVDFVKLAKPLLAKEGEFWAMKGQYPHEELTPCEEHGSIISVDPLIVPGGDGERHLVKIQA